MVRRTVSVMEVTLNTNSISVGSGVPSAFRHKQHRQNVRNSSLAGAML
jgi:hypothetical protein